MVIVIVSFIRHTMYYAVLYFLQFISNHRILNTLADIYLLIRMICIILKQYRKAIKLFKYCFLQHHFKYLTKKKSRFLVFLQHRYPEQMRDCLFQTSYPVPRPWSEYFRAGCGSWNRSCRFPRPV